jgi:hypothetical protein
MTETQCDYCGRNADCSKVTRGIDDHGYPIEYDICQACTVNNKMEVEDLK